LDQDLKQVLAFLAAPPAEGQPLGGRRTTDKYVSERYGYPKLDTLFLTHPVSFKGSTAHSGSTCRTRQGWPRETEIGPGIS
jgi:hypothetical protein